MAEATNTLAGLIQLNDANLADIMPSNLFDSAPLVARLYAKAASNGTQHKYLRQTVASGAAFRAINAGLTKTFSQDELVTETLKLLDASFDIDKGYLDGQVRENVMNLELMRALKGAFFEIEQQVIYGTTSPGSASGFSGLLNAGTLDALADDMVIGAGGTTASEQSSVYLIRSSDEDVALVIGNNGELTVSDPYDTVVYDDPTSAATRYGAERVDVLGHIALQLGPTHSAARIANIHPTDNSAANTLTDDLIYEALSKFPAGKQPNLAVMNRTTAEQLRSSRTATNTTGDAAPIPTFVGNNVEVVITDAIVNTEAVET